MNEKTESVIWGLILLAVGVIFLGNSLDVWHLDIFFKGWWTLFIIIPSFIGLFRRGTIISSTLGLTFGCLLFCAAQDIIEWSMVGKTFFPIILIVIGLSIIFKRQNKKVRIDKGDNEYVAVFSSTTEKVTKEFNGGECVGIFGGVELDLSECKIDKDVVIECVTVFGGIDIRVPKNVNVKTSGVPIFGGIENKLTSEEEKKPTVYINYVCVFAGIDIKN